MNVHLTDGMKHAITSSAQFHKNGSVPNRALTLGTPRDSWVLVTFGKFLITNNVT